MTQTALQDYELDPALRKHDREPSREPLTDDEIAWQKEMNSETIAKLYGINPSTIDRSLGGDERAALYDATGGDSRDALAENARAVKEGDSVDARTHDAQVGEIRAEASGAVERFDGTYTPANPTDQAVEARVLGKESENILEGKMHEGTGLDSLDYRELARAATAGELVRQVTEEHDVSALEHMPPRTGIKVGADIARMVEKYGNADRIPTEELALLGQYLENVEATQGTSEGETYLVFDHETGQPEERSVDDLVAEVMHGDFKGLEADGYRIDDNKREVIARVNEAFGIPSLDATGRADHARRIRNHILEIIEAKAK